MNRPRRVLVLASLLACALAGAVGCSGSAPTPSPPSSPSRATGAPQNSEPQLFLKRLTVPGMPTPPPNGVADRAQVSCAGRDFCVLADEHGLSWTWRGRSWAGPVRFAPEASGAESLISCPVAGFCQAFYDDAPYLLRGGQWTALPAAHFTLSRTVLACGTPDFCLVDGSPTTLNTWNGRSWSATPAVDVRDNSLSLSCAPGSDTCAEITGSGVWLHRAGRWSGPLSPGGTPLAVSCPTASFCMVAAHDRYDVWSGGRWSTGSPGDGIELAGVACASAQFCVGVTAGDLALWDGTRWTPAPTPTLRLPGLLFDAAGQQLSCPQAGWCIGVAPGSVLEVTR